MAGAAAASQVDATIDGVFKVSQRLGKIRRAEAEKTRIANSVSPMSQMRCVEAKVGHGKLNRASKSEGYQQH